MTDAAATFCATMVDEWARAGVTAAFVAPGSRSTPLALALANDRRLRVHVFHDERAAAFAALGHGLATGRPAVVACSSGTAGAHFHAAVIEADAAGVPLIVCTADRPPELWHVGAPQTIDQNRLFGSTPRFFAQPGVPDDAARGSWRSLASQLVAYASGVSGRPGPVHANLSFRDPLTAEPGPLPPGRDGGRPWHHDLRPGRLGAGGDGSGQAGSRVSAGAAADLWHRMRGLDGVIVAGHGTSDPISVLSLARTLGWPVLADHRSGCRAEGQAVAHFDSLLRSPSFAKQVEPDVVLRFGSPPASKVLSQWLAAIDADVVAAMADGSWFDPERVAAITVAEAGLARALLAAVPGDYPRSTSAERWLRADARAASVIAAVLGEDLGTEGSSASVPVTEPGIARAVVAGLPAGGSLVVASSMPVRDLEWFGPNRRDIKVFANRGANGIDGLIATATGLAMTGSPTTLLIGDVAFLHDSTALIGLRDRPGSLTIVVVDNDGGGIFSFLPQADLVDGERFEQLFGTPHGTDLAALSRAHGLDVEPWPPTSFEADKPRVVIATTERQANVELHNRLNASVVDAVESI
jgi:2-succinyl-5-enolpyruvyl-6-hydroxy-3-cyclohexene-1-carboxylate synthase